MITPFVGHFVTVNGRGSIIYNVTVVASNDNEWSQVTLPCFSICIPMPVIGGLTRFVPMAEVAEVEDGIARRISLDVGFRELKNALAVKRENLVSLPLTGAACKKVETVDP